MTVMYEMDSQQPPTSLPGLPAAEATLRGLLSYCRRQRDVAASWDLGQRTAAKNSATFKRPGSQLISRFDLCKHNLKNRSQGRRSLQAAPEADACLLVAACKFPRPPSPNCHFCQLFLEDSCENRDIRGTWAAVSQHLQPQMDIQREEEEEDSLQCFWLAAGSPPGLPAPN